MADNDEPEQLLRLLRLLEDKKDNKVDVKPVTPSSSPKIMALMSIVPTIILIGTMIFNQGIQTEKVDGKIRDVNGEVIKMELQLRAEFIEKLSDYKDKNNELNHSIQEQLSEIRNIQRLGSERETGMSSKNKELDEKLEAVKRSVDDQFRTIIYLKGQHTNSNIP